MRELRQSTQVKVPVGGFFDVINGYEPETGITLGAADEAELMKHDAASPVDISGRTWAAISGMDGHYNLTLTTSDTDTLGNLKIVVQDDSVCLPVEENYSVITQAEWDRKHSTTVRYISLKKNTAFSNFMFLMVDSASRPNPKSGLTITAERAIDGGTFASCANSASEISTSGVYKINFDASDLNGDAIMFKFTGTGADPRFIKVITSL
jgi:hypothetical protein